LSEPSPQARTPAPVIHPFPGPSPRTVVAGPDHPSRPAFETFIADRFQAAYGARLPGHFPLIAGLSARNGPVLAAAGVRFAETGALFLERYLEEPAEQAVAAAFERPVARDGLVEIGSLASSGPGASLQLFTALATWLSAICGRRFAVATVRPELARMLDKAGFGLRRLGEADPARLGAAAGDWGSYYEGRPQVYAAEVGLSTALPLLRQRLAARSLERQVRRLRASAT
jgi:hypothetical protein